MPITPAEADRRRTARDTKQLDPRLEMLIDEMLTREPAADGRWYLDDTLVKVVAPNGRYWTWGDQRAAVRAAYEEAGWSVVCEDGALIFGRPAIHLDGPGPNYRAGR